MRCKGDLPHLQEPLQLDDGWAGRYVRGARKGARGGCSTEVVNMVRIDKLKEIE